MVIKLCLAVFINFGYLLSVKIIYVKELSDVTVKCNFLSITQPVVWRGPTNLTTYTDGTAINPDLKHYGQLVVKGDHSIGEYNLEIKNFTADNAGLYQCNTVNKSMVLEAEYLLKIETKPYVSKPLQTEFYVKTGNSVAILIEVESFEEPTVSWIRESSSGKLGGWKIINDKNKKNCFQLQSTILPSNKNHFKMYKIRLRNGAGVSDFSIFLRQDSSSVTIHPPSMQCNAGSGFNLSCCIDFVDILQWNCRWEHTSINTLIRSMNGVTKGNVSIITVSFCDYQDTGRYTCIWSKSNQILTTSANVQVNSEPIITDQVILCRQSSITLQTKFYSHETPNQPAWYNNGKILPYIGKFNQRLQRTLIVLQYYNVPVESQGYIAELSFVAANKSSFGSVNCQLQNSFGSVETIFQDKDISDAFDGAAKCKEKTFGSSSDFTKTEQSTTEVKNRSANRSVNTYWIITGSVVVSLLVMFIITIAILVRILKGGTIISYMSTT